MPIYANPLPILNSIAHDIDIATTSGPASVKINDTGVWAINLDSGDGETITSTEITAGNYQIDRVRAGITTNIVASTGASKTNNRIYVSYQPTSADWQDGDLLLVTFSGGSVTISGNTTTLTSVFIYSRINYDADIYANVGDPSTDTLTSITAKMGNMTTSLTTKLEDVTTSSTFTFAANTTSEQTVFTITPSSGQQYLIDWFELDLSNLTQVATVKIQKQIDATNWRTVASAVYTPGGNDTSMYDRNIFCDNTSPFRVRIVSAVNEGSNRSIPYNYYYRRIK